MNLYSNETISTIYDILEEMSYDIALVRAIKVKLEGNKYAHDKDNWRFLVSIHNNALKLFITNWCKLFGAKDKNKTYFAKLVSEEEFFKVVDITSFKSYSLEMRGFRDKYVAHTDNKLLAVPCLEPALHCLEAFDAILRTGTVEVNKEEYEITNFVPYTFREGYESNLISIQRCLEMIKLD